MTPLPITDLIARMMDIGIKPQEMPLWRLHKLLKGEALLIVSRNLKCSVCGQNHLMAWAMVRRPKNNLQDLFKP